ncbi:hypothetical protein BIW11_03784 [Tropilaelaps mercedesae]|uniref:Uncharacterized protein n=1 Tax=Tropilaelaps mercedesae TaxID=418985 RepID=A0A1V9XG86_9ACAR|nr:hypothetical protein BIW11_03784 [Tropilaelaps mercedesae]
MGLGFTLTGAIWTLALVAATSAVWIPAQFSRGRKNTTKSEESTPSGKKASSAGVDGTHVLKADDFLIMPQMLMTMGKFTKGLPIEYRPVPLVAGTKQELEQIVKELQLPLDLHQHIKPNMSDADIIVIPLTKNELSLNRRSNPAFKSKPRTQPSAPSTPNPQDNGINKVTLEELLPLLRTHPIPTLVHDEPGLVLNMLRTLAGPKPDGTRAPNEPSDPTSLPDNIQNLLLLAASNPNLVRTMAKFDPDFIPNLVNVILGIDKDES